MDLNIKVPAIKKLLDMTASGVGAVVGPMLARWKARADADALRIKAKGQADAMRLITNAQIEARQSFDLVPSSIRGELNVDDEIRARLSFQEEKRQSNIETVVGMAAQEVGEQEVQDHEIDHDWTARFFADVQDVSSEQMQQLWAKILAGEVETPGRTSLYTLAILKNMTRRDAELFSHIAKFTIQDFILNDESAKSIPEFPNYGTLLHLANYNLINIGLGLETILQGENQYILDDKDTIYSISGTKSNENTNYKISIPCYALTSPGRELYGFIQCPKNKDYLSAFAHFLEKKDFGKLEYAKIFTRDANNIQHSRSWMQVEPRISPERKQKNEK